MIFSFSLYAIFLLAALVIYFGIGTKDLVSENLLKSNKVCYYQL